VKVRNAYRHSLGYYRKNNITTRINLTVFEKKTASINKDSFFSPDKSYISDKNAKSDISDTPP